MTLLQRGYEAFYLEFEQALGAGGGDVMSMDTSIIGTTVRAITVQEQGTTAGQDDILLGVSAASPYNMATGAMLAGYNGGVHSQGIMDVRQTNTSTAFNAGNLLFGKPDTQTTIDANGDDAAAVVDCGVVETLTTTTIAAAGGGTIGTDIVAFSYELCRIVGIALDEVAATTTDDLRCRTLIRLYPPTRFAVT